MENITKEQLEEIKLRALEFYKKNKFIKSPIFWDIKITNEWFNHIEWKDKNHQRNFNEAFTRYVCFFHTKHILENLHLYQEYREKQEKFKIKIWSKKYKEVNENVFYYWFVAIVNKNKHRVRIVVKKNEKSKYFEFLSVVPAWKNSWYLWVKENDLFFGEDLE